MAEAKKDFSKKEAPKEEWNWVIAFFPVLVLFFLIVIVSRMSGETIFGEKVSNSKSTITENNNKLPGVYGFIGNDSLSRGDRIINVNETAVRNEPAGGILGTQDKLDIGILREGPVLAYNINWWRVDYTDAPDGWVEQSSISSKIKTVRGINIVPIVYGFYKPIGYVALIIFLILFSYFKINLMKEQTIAEKKMKLKLEQNREKPIPTATAIEQKPDVQEIPGFQTEEIMPIEQLEKENRWIHIQDLIKSYNVNDWKQAIIEADIILEEMLEKMGYDGVTIGDKLKTIERSDFITLDKAWSAHKVRNQIAHDGSNYKLTREIAEKTIRDFEEVFREFYYI